MADYNANVAPFINEVFYVTAKAGQYPSGGYHSGVDIATTTNSNVYSICNGTVLDVGFQPNGYGNFIIIKDNNSNYAFLFGHLRDVPLKSVGDTIQLGEQFGVEGSTGHSTGIHLHVDMQDYVNNGNQWIYNPTDQSLWGTVYLPAPDYMGFPNEQGISVYYDGVPIPPTPSPTNFKKTKFKWVLYAKKLRNKRHK